MQKPWDAPQKNMLSEHIDRTNFFWMPYVNSFDAQ